MLSKDRIYDKFTVFDLFAHATLISYYPTLLLLATFFIFFVGYIYGYAVSFIFGIKKTFVIGFFVIVLAAIFILLFSSAYILATQCTSAEKSQICSDSINIAARAISSLMLLLSHLFINLVIGHFGVICGILFYFPSEWFLTKYTKFSPLKKSVEEFDTISQSQQNITTGSLNLPEAEQIKNKIRVTNDSIFK